MKRDLTCIACPRGCQITVTLDDNGNITDVTGYTCKRGDDYARAEVSHPVRSLTTTAKVTGGTSYVVSVKTSQAIPKELQFEAMKEINKASIKAPVKIGDVVIKNLLGTGADVVATNVVEKA